MLKTTYQGEGRPEENRHLTRTDEGTLSVDALLALPGKKGEQHDWHDVDGDSYFGNYDETRWREFLDDVAERGIVDPVFVVVEWPGPQAFLYEGNHRLQAAVQLGLEEVPVEVRYFGHAEREWQWPDGETAPTTAAASVDNYSIVINGKELTFPDEQTAIDEATVWAEEKLNQRIEVREGPEPFLQVWHDGERLHFRELPLPAREGRVRTGMAFPEGDTYGTTVYHGSDEHGLTHLEGGMPPYKGSIGAGVYVDFDPDVASFYTGGNRGSVYELKLLVHRDEIFGLDPHPIPGTEGQSILVGEQVEPFQFDLDGTWYSVSDRDPSDGDPLDRDAYDEKVEQLFRDPEMWAAYFLRTPYDKKLLKEIYPYFEIQKDTWETIDYEDLPNPEDPCYDEDEGVLKYIEGLGLDVDQVCSDLEHGIEKFNDDAPTKSYGIEIDLDDIGAEVQSKGYKALYVEGIRPMSELLVFDDGDLQMVRELDPKTLEVRAASTRDRDAGTAVGGYVRDQIQEREWQWPTNVVTGSLENEDVQDLARAAVREITKGLVAGEPPPDEWDQDVYKGVPYYKKEIQIGVPAEVFLVGRRFIEVVIDPFGEAGAAFIPDFDGRAVVVWPALQADGTVAQYVDTRTLFHEMVHAFDDHDPHEYPHPFPSVEYYNSPREFRAYLLMGLEKLESDLSATAEQRLEDYDDIFSTLLDRGHPFDYAWSLFVQNMLGWDTEEKFLHAAATDEYFPRKWMYYLTPEQREEFEAGLLKLRERLLTEYKQTAAENLGLTAAKERAASARDRDAGTAEVELEHLFQQLLPGTRFEGKVFAVGGYVRDQLQEREPADLDMVIEMPYGAQRFAGYLLETFPGKLTEPEPLTYDFPIWYMQFTDAVEYRGELYRVKGAEIDLTDTQTLERLDDGDTTRYGPISEDVQRRDYTVNMLYKDLTSGDILDPTGTGRSDIERGVLRARPDEDAVRAFREQPRRMMRLVRFMAQYDWKPDPGVEQALHESKDALADLSGHGLTKEFTKLKKRGLLDDTLALMREFGMLPYLRQAWETAKLEEE